MATFYIRRPSPKDKRAAFRIYRREQSKATPVIDPRITVINERYKQGEDFAVCLRLITELKDTLRRESNPTPLLIQDNLRVVEKFWAQNTRKYRNVDPKTAYQALVRAATCLGPLTLEHTPVAEIQTRLDRMYDGRQHQHKVMMLNQLLRFLRKPDRLYSKRFSYPEPVYLLLTDFLVKLDKIEPREHKIVLASLFATGARLGELFCLTETGNGTAWIGAQRDKNWVKRDTKTKTRRNCVIIPELESYAVEWAAVPEETRKKLRNYKWASISRKWLGVRAHDLRHSYAKRLAEKGCTLTMIAENLGISEYVAKMFYAGFIQTDYQLAQVRNLLKTG